MYIILSIKLILLKEIICMDKRQNNSYLKIETQM